MKKLEFKNQVNLKIRNAAFTYLLSKIKSKGCEINYDKLSCQPYLLPNSELKLEDQRYIFSYRARMNQIKDNFKKMNYVDKCICGLILPNEHLYMCVILKEGRINKLIYNKIFNGTLSEQKKVINILNENVTRISGPGTPSSH